MSYTSVSSNTMNMSKKEDPTYAILHIPDHSVNTPSWFNQLKYSEHIKREVDFDNKIIYYKQSYEKRLWYNIYTLLTRRK